MERQRVIRIAILNTDMPVPSVHAKLGTYGTIFQNLLSAAASRIAPHIAIESTDFDTVAGEYPDSILHFNAIVITGSSSSSYDDVDWIHKLDNYVAFVYNNHLNVKLFGSCFGHQMICQSLLRNCGVFVEKSPNGWELGVQDIQLTHDFRSAMGSKETTASNQRPATPDSMISQASLPKCLRLQFIHSDRVKVPSPDALPDGWGTMGCTTHCDLQGVFEVGRILTFQGHFEFDKFVNTETLKVFGSSWDPKVLQEGLQSMDREDDAELAAEVVVRFLMEPMALGGMKLGAVTPPFEA